MLIEGFISSQSLHTSATAPLSKAESHFTATAAYHPAASLRNSSVAKGRESNSAAAQQTLDFRRFSPSPLRFSAVLRGFHDVVPDPFGVRMPRPRLSSCSPDFENAVICIFVRGPVILCLFVVVVICNSFLKAVVGPCCSLYGRVELAVLVLLLNCGEMWCCCRLLMSVYCGYWVLSLCCGVGGFSLVCLCAYPWDLCSI
ncbi:hypothetical protein Nepgr_032283 [Nepenthes gracilis]|uniref:Transmembrane protein n=1 Tax=Nepenthes gracilis TaxID=150966 RepID=A0AAD3TIA7_NEPGR|nr:hypothetical protein Nepgr_032283 [Nepenthes gracilis]